MAYNPGGIFQQFQQNRLFEDQQNAVIKSPQKEIPTGTMPKAGQSPYDQKIYDLTGQTFPVATQRDVYILY